MTASFPPLTTDSFRRKVDIGTPGTVWDVNHNLGGFPGVTAVDSAGTVIRGQVEYIDLNNIRISFNNPTSGSVYLS
jgi:hypothetical protein